MTMDFGFTNDAARKAAADAYREAALADGWEGQPTYPTHEPIEAAATLRRDGFVMMILTRDHKPGETWRFCVKVSAWGPDGLSIKPPGTYDWAAIQAGAATCNECGARGATERYNFAGRCCAACLPKMRETHERPGWDS
jgi:hypothetical protein